MSNLSITKLTEMQHFYLESTHSTNRLLIEWLKQGKICLSKPCIMTADTQTAGKGQHGRSWQSPKGNVYLSLYRPIQTHLQNNDAIRAPIDGRLSLCVGYQLTQMPVIQQINQQRIQHHLPFIGVKWVNDIGFYQSNVFQKLSGILIEPVNIQDNIAGVVIGIGLNVQQAPILTTTTQEGLRYQAIDLQQISLEKLHFQLHDYYQMIAHAINLATIQFNQLSQPNQPQIFLEKFTEVDVLFGKMLKITPPIANLPNIVGRAIGIDKQGCLQIQTASNKIERIWTGSIDIAE